MGKVDSCLMRSVRPLRIQSWVILGLAVSLLAGCNPTPAGQGQHSRDGKVYGVTEGLFNSRWWNYQERGRSFADGEFWNEAKTDFTAAIAQRDKDQRRARTYGMHFVDYFPHRELGIVYFRTGQYAAATKELERSLADEESARAKFYLNKTRQALISGQGTDRSPPEIQLFSTSRKLFTNAAAFNLAGVAKDDTYVTSVQVNGQPIFIELAGQELPFTHRLVLKQGPNPVKVQAADIAGKIATLEQTITLDTLGPAVSIADINRSGDGAIKVAGAIVDDSAIVSLTINGVQKKVLPQAKEVLFTESLPEGRLQFTATDEAGNVSEASMDLRDQPNNVLSMRPKPILLAANSLSGLTLPHATLASAEQPKGLTIQTKNRHEETTFQDKTFIEGHVAGANTITDITINGASLQFRPGKRVFFNYLAELLEGKNQFIIAAVDKNGAKTETSVIVVRNITKVRAIGSRMTMAVMPFVPLSANAELTELSSELFQSELNALNRFQLVVRNAAEMEAILTELKFNQSELVDPASAVKIGKITGAETVAVGRIFQKGEAIEITVNHVNSETTKLLSSLDVYAESTDLPSVKYLMAGLALKLQNHFPLLEGLIIKAKGDDYYLDIGTASGLKPEMQVLAYREGEPIKHPVTGKLLSADIEESGTLTVTSVQEDFAIAKLRAPGPSPIKTMDRVITR